MRVRLGRWLPARAMEFCGACNNERILSLSESDGEHLGVTLPVHFSLLFQFQQKLLHTTTCVSSLAHILLNADYTLKICHTSRSLPFTDTPPTRNNKNSFSSSSSSSFSSSSGHPSPAQPLQHTNTRAHTVRLNLKGLFLLIGVDEEVLPQ